MITTRSKLSEQNELRNGDFDHQDCYMAALARICLKLIQLIMLTVIIIINIINNHDDNNNNNDNYNNNKSNGVSNNDVAISTTSATRNI